MIKIEPYYKAGRLIRFWGWISLIIMFFFIMAYVVPTLAPIIFEIRVSLILKIVFSLIILVGLSVLQLKIGTAIQSHKGWGRIGGIFIGINYLFIFPIGTISGLYIIWCLIKGWELQMGNYDPKKNRVRS